MNGSQVALLLFAIVVVWFLFMKKEGCAKREGLGGDFIITSGLAMNNRNAYTLPPSEDGAFSGGSFLDHRVIV